MQTNTRLTQQTFTNKKYAPGDVASITTNGRYYIKVCKKGVWEILQASEKLANLKDVDPSSGDHGQFREPVVSQVSIPHTVDPVSQTVLPHQICHHHISFCVQ